MENNPDQINALVALVLTCVGSFCAGLSVGHRYETKLRVTIVRLEHQLARKENREPRDIDTII